MNKKGILKDFRPSPTRPLQSSIFGFTQNLTLVSYAPQKNKSVVLLSSQIRVDPIEPEKKHKPYMILHYNETRGAVDTGDKDKNKRILLRSSNQ